jgi:hypothetical protein
MNETSNFICAVLILAAFPGHAADLNAEQLRAIIAAAEPSRPADLSGKALDNLDLSNVDFKRANLSGANLFGAKLVGADLSGTDLSGAKLDLAWIMRANFTNADLSNASLLGLVVSSGLDISPAEAPVFRGANLSRSHYCSAEPVRSQRGQFRQCEDGRRYEKPVHGIDEGGPVGLQFVGSKLFRSGSQSCADAVCRSDRSQSEQG